MSEKVLHKYMTVTLPDGSKWGVPVEMIARNRAAHYASEFELDLERSLAEDTLPLFEEDESEIADWAVNNMNWGDFNGHQVLVASAPSPDFERAWMTGEKGFSSMGTTYGVPCVDELARLAAENERLTAENERLQRDYNELLYQVRNNYPGETRHQAALRCLRNAEHKTIELVGYDRAALEEGK